VPAPPSPLVVDAFGGRHSQHVGTSLLFEPLSRSSRRPVETVSATTHRAGTPASNALLSISLASSPLVANGIFCGTPASARRSASSVHSRGKYKDRSTNAVPFFEAYAKNTPTTGHSPSCPPCLCTGGLPQQTFPPSSRNPFHPPPAPHCARLPDAQPHSS
jgi:hypothetical protein